MIRSLLLGILALAALVVGTAPPATAQCTGLPAANTICAGPATGTGFPGFRALVAADVPAVAMGGSLTGTFPNPTIANNAISNAMLASGSFTNITGLGTATFTTLTGATITGLSNPTNATDAANKSYVDSVAVGLIPLTSARLGTAAVLPNTPTYANGASGVGATLTAGANAALTVDGTSVSASDRILVKTQAAPAQNGIYTVTTVGDGSTPWVITRSTDFDTAAEMLRGSFVFVTAGSANAGSGWALAANVTTVGTTAANFNQISSNTTYSATSPITLTGTVFSLGTVGAANGGTGLNSGTSGGVLAFTGATTVASSAALTANGFVLGGGAGAVPTSTARPTAGQLCFGQSSGACAMAVLNGDVVNTAAGLATIQAGVIVNSYVNASAAIVATKLNFAAPGTGGTSTTLDLALRKNLWAHQYGAVCDGVTNDTTAFQNMINEAQTLGATANFIGSCLISATVSITGSVILQGNGYGDSILVVPPNVNAIHVNAGLDVTLQGFYLTQPNQAPCGGTASTGVAAIKFTAPGGATTVRDIYTNCAGPAIQYDTVSRGLIDRVTIGNIPSSQFGVSMVGGYNGDNEIRGSRFDGVSGTGGALYCEKCAGLRFLSNKVNGTGIQYGIYIDVPNGFADADLFITGNSFEGIDMSSGVGIRIGTSGGSFGTMTVTGNEIVGFIGLNIVTGGAGTWFYTAAITGNVFGVNGAGVAVDTARGIIVSGNSILCGNSSVVPIVSGGGTDRAVFGPNISSQIGGGACAASIYNGTNITTYGP